MDCRSYADSHTLRTCSIAQQGKRTQLRACRCTALVEEAAAVPSGIEAIRRTDELSDTVRL
jgi:hypothetical protein